MKTTKSSQRYYIKLCSLNPDKYETITAENALDGYTDYLANFSSSLSDISLRQAKTFSQWLDTEI